MEVVVERAAAHELHDHGEVAFLETRGAHLHDVRVRDGHPVAQLLLKQRLVGVRKEDLDRHLAVVVNATAHDACGAPANVLEQLDVIERHLGDADVGGDGARDGAPMLAPRRQKRPGAVGDRRVDGAHVVVVVVDESRSPAHSTSQQTREGAKGGEKGA